MAYRIGGDGVEIDGFAGRMIRYGGLKSIGHRFGTSMGNYPAV